MVIYIVGKRGVAPHVRWGHIETSGTRNNELTSALAGHGILYSSLFMRVYTNWTRDLIISSEHQAPPINRSDATASYNVPADEVLAISVAPVDQFQARKAVKPLYRMRELSVPCCSG